VFKCKRCGSTNSSHIISTDHQVIFDCADCEYVTTWDNKDIKYLPEELGEYNHDEYEVGDVEVEECPACGYEGILTTEQIYNDVELKICPSCKHSYAVNFDGGE